MMQIKNIAELQQKAHMKTLVADIKLCMCCVKDQEYPKVRAVGVSQMDDEGNIWFLCNKQHHTANPLHTGSKVELIYSEPGQSHLLTVYGTSIITRSRQKVHDLWTSRADEWFELGIDDPNISLVKIIPSEAYYWDTQMEHMVALVHMAKAA